MLLGELGSPQYPDYEQLGFDETICLFEEQCMRARCKYCGFVRAKNSTRQVEHLEGCMAFLNSNEGQQAANEGYLQQTPVDGSSRSQPDVFRGTAPNPNLSLARKNTARLTNQTRTNTRGAPNASRPSLITFLIDKTRNDFTTATQQPFLPHAGCGTLSAAAVEQFLTQQGHISRAMPSFIGRLLGKMRLNDTKTPQSDTTWRAFDLLASTLNNAKRELEFLRSTAEKHGLHSEDDSTRHGTRGLVDLMESVTAPSASLLEGMMVLWAIEHLHCVSWKYADSFHKPGAGPAQPTSYSVPSYYQPGSFDLMNPHDQGTTKRDLHTAAIHEAFIPNWTSAGFSQFVDACKAIVDEIANAQTTGNGAKELNNSVEVFAQVLWFWKQIWPDVTGMGEDNGAAENGESENPIEIQDEDSPDVEFSS
ncbi:hypothetical protein LTR37_000154 [Vermiconidia calcicola]|uniref:Uncharacterized protein n=1 Tax=Vermiconidia calcicola TaxID=1690605 RepID=A0ACC3NZQ1_9PEZI|nr:hypothetical protein LTR37_000154 [Vermiconidia calcicola]